VKTLRRRYAAAMTAGLAALLAGVLAASSPAGGNGASGTTAGAGASGTTAGVTDGWAPLRLPGADEVESYADVLQMRDASDLVVVGRFTDFRPGRTMTVRNGLGDGVDDTLFWIDGTVQLEEVITDAGTVDLGGDRQSLTVEFFVGGLEEAEYIDADVTRLRAALGTEIGRSVLFLRLDGSPRAPGPANPCVDWPVEELEAFNMTPDNCNADEIRNLLGAGDAGAPATATGRLRLVSSYGLVAATNDRPVDAPLADIPEASPDSTSTANQDGSATRAEPQAPWTSLDELIAYLRS
jgi:hypothetical protein